MPATKKPAPKPKPAPKIDLAVEYERACKALDKANKLLKQERERWKKIHQNPIQEKPEEASLETTEKDMVVRVTIDPKVKNEVNSQAITREFHFGRKPSDSFFDYVDLGIMACYSHSLTDPNLRGVRGILPGVFLGLRPLDHWTKIPAAARGWGLGGFCDIFTGGVTLYYSHPSMGHASLHVMVGWDFKGKIAPGVALGVRF